MSKTSKRSKDENDLEEDIPVKKAKKVVDLSPIPHNSRLVGCDEAGRGNECINSTN
jgi:hypothetical protein